MLANWRVEILNCYGWRVMNRLAEGKNNRIRTIICAGYGCRNIGNLTQYIMPANHPTPATRDAPSPHLMA